MRGRDEVRAEKPRWEAAVVGRRARGETMACETRLGGAGEGGRERGCEGRKSAHCAEETVCQGWAVAMHTLRAVEGDMVWMMGGGGGRGGGGTQHGADAGVHEGHPVCLRLGKAPGEVVKVHGKNGDARCEHHHATVGGKERLVRAVECHAYVLRRRGEGGGDFGGNPDSLGMKAAEGAVGMQGEGTWSATDDGRIPHDRTHTAEMASCAVRMEAAHEGATKAV